MYQKVIRGFITLAVTTAGSLTLAGAAQAATTPAPPTPPPVTVVSTADTFANVVINPTSTLAYLTVPSLNQVDVLDLRKGTFDKPIPVGSDPHGIDITPDGKTLLVADVGGATISEVTLPTDKVTTITTPGGFLSDTAYSIVALNNGNALFTTTFSGSGFGANAYDLNLATGAISVVSGIGINGLVTEATPLCRSADYSTAAAVLGDDSGGPISIYTAATATAVSGSLGTFIGSCALSGNGSVLLVDGTSVVDPATGLLLGTIAGAGGSAALNASGTTGYALSGSTITQLDTTTFSTGQTTSLPEPASGGSQLAISPNGQFLVAETSGSATIIRI